MTSHRGPSGMAAGRHRGPSSGGCLSSKIISLMWVSFFAILKRF